MDKKSISQIRAAITGSRGRLIKAYKREKASSTVLGGLGCVTLGPDSDSSKIKTSTYCERMSLSYGTPRDVLLLCCQQLVELMVECQERVVLEELSNISGRRIKWWSSYLDDLLERYPMTIISLNCRDELLDNKWWKRLNYAGRVIYRTFIEGVELGVVDRPETQELQLQIMAFWHGGVLVSPKNTT